MRGKSADFILKLIILDRFLMGSLLIFLSIGLINLMNKDLNVVFQELIEALNWDVDHFYVDQVFSYLSLINNQMILGVSLGAFLYGVLCLIQGYGLHLRKGWAEYLTVVAISLFIPFEIYEVLQKLTLFPVSVLVINVSIVIFLIRHKELFPKKKRCLWDLFKNAFLRSNPNES